MADQSRTKVGCTFGLGIVLTIVLAIVLSNVGWSAVTLLVMIAFIAAVIFAGVMYSFTRRIDLSNNFREFALPVLTVFREDFDAAKPIHLRMNLDPPTAASKLASESAPYKRGAYYKIVDKMFVDKWMTASAMLVDGTKLSWSVTDNVRERTKKKKTPRGKYKTKTKFKKKTEMEVELALRKKAHAFTSAVEGQVAGDDKRHKLHVEREVTTESLDPLTPRALIDVVAEVYRNTRRPMKEAGA